MSTRLLAAVTVLVIAVAAWSVPRQVAHRESRRAELAERAHTPDATALAAKALQPALGWRDETGADTGADTGAGTTPPAHVAGFAGGSASGSSDEIQDLNERARAALDAGRPAEAVMLLESAHQLDPSEAVIRGNLAYAYYKRALIMVEQRHDDQALADLGRASELDPEEAGYGVHRAQLLLRRYRLTEAETDLRAVLARHATRADAQLLLGDVLNLQDRLPEALAAYTLAEVNGEGEVKRVADEAHRRTSRQYAVEQDYLTDTTDAFVIRHPRDADGTQWGTRLGGILERARAEVCNALGYYPRERTTVVLYPPESFQQATAAHEWVGGLFDRKIRLPIGDLDREQERIEEAFRHEFAHLIVSQLAPQCPSLANEGLAQVVEHGRGQGMARLVAYLETRPTGRAALPQLVTLPDSFITLTDRDQVSMAYLVSFAFVDHVMSMHGSGAVLRWIEDMATAEMEPAYKAATNRSLSDEEKLFREMVLTAP